MVGKYEFFKTPISLPLTFIQKTRTKPILERYKSRCEEILVAKEVRAPGTIATSRGILRASRSLLDTGLGFGEGLPVPLFSIQCKVEVAVRGAMPSPKKYSCPMRRPESGESLIIAATDGCSCYIIRMAVVLGRVGYSRSRKRGRRLRSGKGGGRGVPCRAVPCRRGEGKGPESPKRRGL